MTKLSDLPPGAQRVIVASLELLSVLRERAEFLPDDVARVTADFEAVVCEHIGVIE